LLLMVGSQDSRRRSRGLVRTFAGGTSYTGPPETSAKPSACALRAGGDKLVEVLTIVNLHQSSGSGAKCLGRPVGDRKASDRGRID